MKRPIFNFFILLGALAILFAGLVMVLILAPGVKIFDIQYIRSTEPAYAKNFTAASDSENGYETIEINGLTTNVNVEFVQAQTVYISYRQHFKGFTRTKIDSPELSVEESGNTLKILVKEYESFGYGSNDDEDGLVVNIPIYYKGNVVINSNNSNVRFSGLYGNANNVTVSTNGKVEFRGKFRANNLTLNVKNKHVALGDEVDILKSITMTSTRSSLTINNMVGENISYTSKYGHLNFVGANGNVNANTTHGKIGGIGDVVPNIFGSADLYAGGGISVYNISGDAKLGANSGDIIYGSSDTKLDNKTLVITSKSGDVALNGEIESETINISTTSGDIKVGSVHTLNVTSKRGSLTIDSVYELNSNTARGSVNVNSVSGKAVVNTTKGSVRLSAPDGGSVQNADVTTTNGSITINNPVGSVYNVSTKKGAVNFYGNADISSEVNVIASGKSNVYMTNVSGRTVVTTKGKVDLKVSNITAPIIITGKNKDINITVPKDLVVYYDLHSNKKNVLIEGIEIDSKSYYNSSEALLDSTITVSTGWGQIKVSKSN